MMPVTLQEIMDRLPAAERQKVEARAAELIAGEQTLQDLRKARALTQARMAELLGTGQDSVSRLEKRSDLLLSTLAGYVAALGGRLELVARFDDRPPVVISGIGYLDNGGAQDEAVEPPKPQRRRSAGRAQTKF